MIPTGLQKLDGFLSGGIPGAVITDIFGPHGTGKTQLLFQLSCSAAMDGGQILYVDTSGMFRPERIVEIQKHGGYDQHTLDRITVLRVTNTSELVKSLYVMDSKRFDAILVDNITDLFSYEFQTNNHMFEKNLLFMQYMQGLSSRAVNNHIPIVMTNMIRQADDRETENMHVVIDPFTHIKIRLSRDSGKFLAHTWWMQNSMNFSYKIGPGGLFDA